PYVPPKGWWIITSLFGRATRFPFSPAANRNAPIEAAMPVQIVDTSDLMNCIVSKIVMLAVLDPPGDVMEIEIYLFESSASRNNNCATMELATLSSMALPNMIIRSFNRRERSEERRVGTA